VRPLAWGYKSGREIARRMPHFRGEPAALHPAFAPGGPASIIAHAEGPVAFDAPRIVYSDDDERALEAYVRAMGAWTTEIFVFFFFLSSHDENPFYSANTGWHSVSLLSLCLAHLVSSNPGLLFFKFVLDCASSVLV